MSTARPPDPAARDADADALAAFLSLLSDPDSPRVHVLFARGFEVIPVREFCDFAARRGGFGEANKEDLDRLIERAGGRRLEVTDPWRRLENGLRRFAGAPAKDVDELWEVPRRAIYPPTAMLRRTAERIAWSLSLLISAEIAAVVILAGLSAWIAIAVLLAYGEIHRRWRPLSRIRTPVFVAYHFALVAALTAAIIVLALE